MTKPLFLISGSDVSRANYEHAIQSSGGLFLSYYLPSLRNSAQLVQTAKKCDALLLAGGGDIHPSFFLQETAGSHPADLARDTIELSLVQAFLSAGKPIIGICRGFQLMNVALGGTLHQDLSPESTRIHAQTGSNDAYHLTTCAPDSFLEQLYGTAFVTNSAHHQSIDRLADSLQAIQWAVDDGCIEAVVHNSFPYIGVQWHPERLNPNGSLFFQYSMTHFFST